MKGECALNRQFGIPLPTAVNRRLVVRFIKQSSTGSADIILGRKAVGYPSTINQFNHSTYLGIWSGYNKEFS